MTKKKTTTKKKTQRKKSSKPSGAAAVSVIDDDPKRHAADAKTLVKRIGEGDPVDPPPEADPESVDHADAGERNKGGPTTIAEPVHITDKQERDKHYDAMLDSSARMEALRVQMNKSEIAEKAAKERHKADKNAYLEATKDHLDLAYMRGDHAQGKLDFTGSSMDGKQGDSWRSWLISTIPGLSAGVMKSLAKHGYINVGKVADMLRDETVSVPGIGPKGRDNLIESMERFWSEHPEAKDAPAEPGDGVGDSPSVDIDPDDIPV